MDEFQSADSILAEIQSESFQHLLGAVRCEASLLGSTRIPALDAHISGSHSTQRPAHATLNRGDVFEIQGPAASGKSHLLFHLIITCITPPTIGSINLGGWGKAAILFDTDGTFDVRRLHMLLVSRLSRLLAEDRLTAEPELAVTPEELASRYLMNLHIFRPTSSLQLAATLVHLPAYHATHPDLQSTEIGVIAIDSMSAFYWQDRFTVEHMRAANQSIPGTNSDSAGPVGPLQHVLAALQRLRVSHGPVIVLTNWGLHPLKKPGSSGESLSPFYKQHLHPFPSPFERQCSSAPFSSPGAAHQRVPDQSSRAVEIFHPHSFVLESELSHVNQSLALTHHITLKSSPTIPFDPSLSLDEAIQEDARRLTVVKEGKVPALVRTPGSTKLGQFAFFITEREVVVDPDVSAP